MHLQDITHKHHICRGSRKPRRGNVRLHAHIYPSQPTRTPEHSWRCVYTHHLLIPTGMYPSVKPSTTTQVNDAARHRMSPQAPKLSQENLPNLSRKPRIPNCIIDAGVHSPEESEGGRDREHPTISR